MIASREIVHLLERTVGLPQTHDLLDTPSRGDYAFPTPPTRATLDELWEQVPEDRADSRSLNARLSGLIPFPR